MQSFVVRKHWFGAAIIALLGALALGLLIYMSLFLFGPKDPAQYLIGFASFVVGAFAIIQLLVYRLNGIYIGPSGIEYRKYNGLFYSNFVEADWNTVQRIDVRQGSIFAKLLGYGDLMVITAGDRQNLGMTLVPDAVALKQYIDDNATFGAAA